MGFSTSKGFCNCSKAENLAGAGEGSSSGRGKKNYITACLLPSRDIRGNLHLAHSLAKFFNCLVICEERKKKGDERKLIEITNHK